ncbi:MAG TPA: hypothetical protein PKV21_09285 [bacterium]|nr:hypothetical protein [bacterium]HOM27677.1 hypothetical protein [bacterium]
MRDFYKILKRWFLWVIISYLFVIGIFTVIIFIPQKNQIVKYKTEKDLLTYNYLKIKNDPEFFQTIKKTIDFAEDKIYNFEWLNYTDDPNLAIYEYLEEITPKEFIEIISVKKEEIPSDLYFFWEVKLMGSFKGFFYFINRLESGRKYLKIEEIEVLEGENEKNIFNLKIAGIKKVK